MNYKAVLYILGKIFIILGALMLLPFTIALYYRINGFPEASYISFLVPIGILLAAGFILTLKKPKSFNIYAKEGFVICGLGWLIMSALGALPFVISGCIPSFIDAFLKQRQALPQQVQLSFRRYIPCRNPFCSGEASPTGSAVWVYCPL